jgi:hypothetical protein
MESFTGLKSLCCIWNEGLAVEVGSRIVNEMPNTINNNIFLFMNNFLLVVSGYLISRFKCFQENKFSDTKVMRKKKKESLP